MDIQIAIAGILTGIAASMGFGGGFILLIWLTAFLGVSQVTAAGINLLFFLPVAFTAMLIHSKNKMIEWKIVPKFCLYGAAGVIAGVLIKSAVSESLLQKLFAVLLIRIGFKELRTAEQPVRLNDAANNS
jgi:uncharacterized membrane protein YfcA